jgi:hypothetical protein
MSLPAHQHRIKIGQLPSCCSNSRKVHAFSGACCQKIIEGSSDHTAGADRFFVPNHRLQSRLTFWPYFCGSEHGINMIAFPAIFSNKTFSKNITSLSPKHRQFFMVFSSGKRPQFEA